MTNSASNGQKSNDTASSAPRFDETPHSFQVGLNMRSEWVHPLLRTPILPISFVEVIADNYLEPSANHAPLRNIAKRAPLHLHCVGMNLGGYDPIDVEYIGKLRSFADSLNPRVISDHLCVQAHKGVYVHDLLPFPWNTKSLERISSRIDQTQQILGRQLAVENLSQYVFFADSKWSEAEFLQKLCEKTGCGLLVDINNLVVNEKNHNIDPQPELDIMLACKVLEAHVAGSEWIDSVWVDTHGSDVEPRTFELLSYFVSSYRKKCSIPIPIVYERDTNLPPIEEVLDQCRKIKNHLLGSHK